MKDTFEIEYEDGTKPLQEIELEMALAHFSSRGKFKVTKKEDK